MATALPGNISATGPQGSAALFGGNVLAPTRPLLGENGYEAAIEDMNVTGLRFPGGSLTEYTFDITNPDATRVLNTESGQTTDYIALSDFMGYAGANGHAVTIVLPTRNNLSEMTDANGDRSAAIPEENLREFVHGVVTGDYGDATISNFEIGNEYWGSGGMSAVEYGRVASEMTRIIQDELDLITEAYGIETDDIRILVQNGANYDHSRISEDYVGWDADDVIADLQARYPDADIDSDNIRNSGEPNWTEINDELIQMSFDTAEEIEALDGIVAHVYSRGEDNPNSRSYDLGNIERNWLEDEGFEKLDVVITEWNQKSTSGLDRTEDYGLHQAHEMLNLIEEFMAHGVDEAHIWPLIQNTANSLSTGMDYSGMTAPGEVFAMMSENIPGKRMIDFSPNNRETEYEGDDVDVHGFGGEGDLLFYIASTSHETTLTDLDLSGLLAGYDGMEITVLGMKDGQAAGDTRSEPELRHLDPAEVMQDGVLEADLAADEIMQVLIRGVEPTQEFASTWAILNAGDDEIVEDSEDDPLDDILGGGDDPQPPEDEAPDDEVDPIDDADDVGFSGLFMMLALLPLLALMGL